MMSGPEVLEILDALAQAGGAAWVDGGWGVDALLGEQTREHEDLDLVIALDDGGEAERALSALGFAMSEDERPTRFVLAHDGGRRIDFHTVVFDEGAAASSGCRTGDHIAIRRKASRAKGLSAVERCGA
jgi:lincosamide nucleotidyltransferase A/C/D/E